MKDRKGPWECVDLPDDSTDRIAHTDTLCLQDILFNSETQMQNSNSYRSDKWHYG